MKFSKEFLHVLKFSLQILRSSYVNFLIYVLIVCCGAELPLISELRLPPTRAKFITKTLQKTKKVKTIASGAPSGSSLTSPVEVHFRDERSSEMVRVRKSNR